MNSRLMLVRAEKNLGLITPAAMYITAAAKYVKIDIADFRELVRDGIIPARAHPGRSRDLFLKEDLDVYLRSLPIRPQSDSRIAARRSLVEPLTQEVSNEK
jgi:hypothetical protein